MICLDHIFTYFIDIKVLVCVRTVFNEHKACLFRVGEHGLAIQQAIREQCGEPANPSVCMSV